MALKAVLNITVQTQSMSYKNVRTFNKLTFVRNDLNHGALKPVQTNS